MSRYRFTPHTANQVLVFAITWIVVLSAIGPAFVAPAAAAGETDVAVGPDRTITPDSETTVSVAVTDADGGVGAYQLEVTTSDPAVAEITDVELHGHPGIPSSSISDDGSQASAAAALTDTKDTGTVSIVTVTVRGNEPGTATLSTSITDLGDESGESYTITNVTSATVEVQDAPTIDAGTVTPDVVEGGTTTDTTVEFGVRELSEDGNTDTITITGESDISFASPEVTITDGNGTELGVESGPSLSDDGGTDNAIAFAIAPDNSRNTSAVSVAVDAETTYPAVESNRTRTFGIDVADSEGGSATTSLDVAVRPTADTEKRTVSLTPSFRETTVGSTVTYDLNVTEVTNGIGAYEYSISLNNTGATITGIEPGGDPGTDDVTINDDGSSAEVTAALADTPDTGNVSIGTVSVAGEEPGPVGLDVSVADVGDETGRSYAVGDVAGATLLVTAGPGDVTGDGMPATDPDSDGAYEDVNGDGRFSPTDIQALFVNLDSEIVENNPAAFDFNGDGAATPSDVQALFSSL